MTNEDRLPHDRAVWREDPPVGCEGSRQVSVDYGDGLIERSFVGQVSWRDVVRWRYGWPPA